MNIKNRIKPTIKKYIPRQGLNFIRNVILKKPGGQILKNFYKYISAPKRNKIYLTQLGLIEKSCKISEDVPFNMFKDVDDDFWFWLFTKGYRSKPSLHPILPYMPEERIQLQYTSISGDTALEEAFLFYSFIQLVLKREGILISPDSKVLDFGCGWGRIIRFFIKDVPSANLYGIDCDDDIIKVCQASNFNCSFDVNGIYPPTVFKDNYFDLIYSYSVFSHLSEDAHKLWLTEFSRILKPGGILIATTRHRDFILTCARLREMKKQDVPFFATGPSESFLDTSKSLMEYDNGEYVYEPIGGGGIRDGSFYGETCIPEKYVKKEWIKYFSRVDFVDHKKHRHFDQNAIIAVK